MRLLAFCTSLLSIFALINTVNVSANESKITDQLITVCEDENFWAPYLFSNNNAEEGVAGAGVDLLREVLKESNLKHRFYLKPWKRCLNEVASGKMDILSNASSNPERLKVYLRSRPIYSVNYTFMFNKTKYPNGPQIDSLNDLHDFVICGMRNYNVHGLDFDAKKMYDYELSNPSQLVEMTRKARCDLSIYYKEIIMEAGKTKAISLDNIGFMDIPGALPLEIYFFVSKKINNAESIMSSLNNNLVKFEQNGRKNKIFQQYGL